MRSSTRVTRVTRVARVARITRIAQELLYAAPCLLCCAAWTPAEDGEVATQFHSSDFEGARSCKKCHPRQYLEWRGSAHAYAMADPAFRACNRQALEDTAGEIGTHCLECHSPIGTRSGELRGDYNLEALSPQIQEGVSCEVCHRMEPAASPGPVANAAFELGPAKVFFGRLKEPEPNAAHRSEESRFVASSEFCGSCHDVIHKSRSIEKTFAEWAGSAYATRGTQCQDCHMLRYSGQAALNGPFRDTLRRHNFPGIFTPLSPFPNRGYQAEESRKFLRTAARLSINFPGAILAGADLGLEVTVKNSGVGHNFPAASVRQVWLEVSVLDGARKPIFFSGGLDANGDLMDPLSELEPGADPWLVQFSDYFVDGKGKTVPYWLSEKVVERSLKPLEERRAAYRVAVPHSLAGGTARVRVRLLLRSLAPHTLRRLGLGELAASVPIVEMDAVDSGPLPVLDIVPRRTEYSVPGDFAGIQEAIDALADGDTVTVGPGDHAVRRPVDFRGKRISLRSSEGPQKTFLRFAGDVPEAQRGSVVVFRSGEGPGTIIEGFTVQGGRGTTVGGVRRGGGIYIAGSSPTVAGNVLTENGAAGGFGGGICCEGGRPVLRGNEVRSCWADRGGGIALRASGDAAPWLGANSIQGNLAREGGGIFVEARGGARIERCVVAGNIALEEGGGIYGCDGAFLELDHLTVVHNRADKSCGALRGDRSKPAAVSSSIFWFNDPRSDAAGLSFCIADEASAREEALAASSTRRSAFPIFLDPTGCWLPAANRELPTEVWPASCREPMQWTGGDYHVLSGSPAIDGGDPQAPGDPDDTRSDAGALWFEQRLKAFTRGDLDGGGRVSWVDLLLLACHLRSLDALPCADAADVDDSGAVDPVDLLRLAAYLFSGRLTPAHPFPACGLDPTFGEGMRCDEEPAPCRSATDSAPRTVYGGPR